MWTSFGNQTHDSLLTKQVFEPLHYRTTTARSYSIHNLQCESVKKKKTTQVAMGEVAVVCTKKYPKVKNINILPHYREGAAEPRSEF